MATIISDGKGNYLTLDASGQNWVPTSAPDTKPQGGNRFTDAPPEDKPPTIDFANRQGQPQPSLDDLGLSIPRSPPPGGLVDTSITPGPNVASLMPLSRDAEGNMRFAVPNAVRAILTQGPQVTDGKLSVPGATVDQGTGALGLTPEATAGGMLLAGGIQGGLRFSDAPRPPVPAPPEPKPYRPPPSSAPSFVPPDTAPPPPPVPLNRVLELLQAQLRVEANRPAQIPPTTTTDPFTGQVSPITTPRNVLAPKDPPGSLDIPQPPAPAEPPTPPPTPTPAPAAPADPPIMSQADMRARGHGYFNVADQTASQGAMLPDTNAAAVRKLFGDFIPGDPEAARISAGEPAMQAAKNVDATGPMSYDTAIRIDRDLTSRMRGASGTDAHDLSQLQQSLRDQMDQVPDLENLRLGRQAWKQSIKQGQMEDINAGAALKNDPAQADTYVRQRAAALLKNDNAMRYWTPEEQAQLTTVAQSGDIGMLGRLTTSLIKPISRVAFGTVGHLVAGPLGAIVGGEVGGDVGATAASRVRSYMSPTNLDPVMRQITLGVPPPNVLGPRSGARSMADVDPAVLAALQEQLRQSATRQARDTSTP